MGGIGSILEEFGVQISLLFDKAKAEEAQAALKRIGDELRHTAFEAAGAAAALFAIGNNFTSNARELEQQADMLGLNTKQLQEYEYAAKVAAGVNRDELVGSLQHLGDMMDRARAGDQDARQALLQLAHAGIGEEEMLKKLSDKSYTSADAMKDLSEGFMNIAKQSPQAAARLAEFAFGSAKLIPLLRQGPKAFNKLIAEADKNFVLNDKMIKQGAELDRQFTRIWLTFKKFAYEIGFNVMKHIKPLVDEFTKWFSVNKDVISSGINSFLDQLVEAIKYTFIAANELWTIFLKISDVFGGIGPTIKGMVEAFLLFKGLAFLGSLFTVVSSLAPLFATIVTVLTPVAGVIAAISAPILAVVAGLGAAYVAVSDLMTLYEKMKGPEGMSLGDAFKETITGKGIQKVKSWFGGADSNANQKATASASSSGAPMVNQENHFNTNMTVAVPPGTTASHASGIVSKAAVDSHDKMMIQAKQNGARKQIN